jgi:hypothetical protein
MKLFKFQLLIFFFLFALNTLTAQQSKEERKNTDASRKVIYWTNIDNSGDFNQVFIPYKFDSLNPGHTLLEKDENFPCSASFLSTEQQRE